MNYFCLRFCIVVLLGSGIELLIQPAARAQQMPAAQPAETFFGQPDSEVINRAGNFTPGSTSAADLFSQPAVPANVATEAPSAQAFSQNTAAENMSVPWIAAPAHVVSEITAPNINVELPAAEAARTEFNTAEFPSDKFPAAEFANTEIFTTNVAPTTAAPWLRFATDYTYPMLDFLNRQTDKETILLNYAASNGGAQQLTLGAQFRASALFAQTNRADKFPYLGRFPTDFEGRKASDFRLLQANQNATYTFAPMVHGYFETLFSDVFSFGDFKQGSFQVRQAYVVLGNFERSPWYAFAGKKNVGFGDFGTLNPFTQPITWHYFAALAEGAGVGYDNGRFRLSATALNGSRGIRVSDSSAKGDVNNFAVNGLMRVPTRMQNSALQIGAGYLHGTIYNAAEAEHLNADLFGPDNAAWDVNARFRKGRFQLLGEYVQTVDPWPVTDSNVSAYHFETAYDVQYFNRPGRMSLSWGEGIQGANGTEFEFNRQMVIGYQIQPLANVNLSFEYVRSSGFAPLIAIERVSDRDVVQDSFVAGATIRL